MRKMCIFRGLAAVACVFALVSAASADTVNFNLETNSWAGNANAGVYGLSSGAVIDYDVYVEIVDTEADGPDSQGLALFSLDIVTNTGITQPVLSPSPSIYTTYYAPTTPLTASRFSTNLLWTGTGKNATPIGGYGFNVFPSAGNNALTTGNVEGFGSSFGVGWDAGTGTNPARMANVGYGAPNTAVDTGGTAFPNYTLYGATARARWYLYRGQILVPDAAGSYTVNLNIGAANFLDPTSDLNTDGTNVIDSTTLGGTATSGFSFTVVPEPATLSALLIAGVGLVMRRRR